MSGTCKTAITSEENCGENIPMVCTSVVSENVCVFVSACMSLCVHVSFCFRGCMCVFVYTCVCG